MRKTDALWRARGVRASDFLKPAEGLNFNNKFDILPVAELLEKRFSGVAEQGYTILLYGKSPHYYGRHYERKYYE
jgi:hypothetical protein